jgi:CheY-like chemotaxis protein
VGDSRTHWLIVDDDEDVCVALSGILQKRGYEVATACDGLAALTQLREGLRPRLIFLDYQMPVMNGEEFCDHCAREPTLAAIPIVIVSSDTASALKLAKERAGGLLTKPVPIDKLLAALTTIV